MTTDSNQGIIRLPSCYLPSVEYIRLLSIYNKVYIDLEEPYQKQTVRNRCFILSPNGIQCLTVPVSFHSSEKQKTATIKISYDEQWQKVHCRAIQSAYGRSAWFEFIYSDLELIILSRFEYLHELNTALLHLLLKKFKQRISFTDSEKYNLDFLKIANTKNTIQQTSLILEKYQHVFSDRFGFVPNLSSIDLLFNMGCR